MKLRTLLILHSTEVKIWLPNAWVIREFRVFRASLAEFNKNGA